MDQFLYHLQFTLNDNECVQSFFKADAKQRRRNSELKKAKTLDRNYI